MDRLQRICAEIIRLYRKQLNVWVRGNVRRLKKGDLRRYDRRRNRIDQLRKELEHDN